MSNDYPLAGKITLITGASAGMGLAIARKYLACGATVIATGRHLEKLVRIQNELPPDRQARFVPMVSDVGQSADNQALLDDITQRFGCLDVLVNNAGIMDNMTPVGDVTDELWQNVININLRGPFELCRGAVQLMLKAGHGNIINIASGGGIGGGRAGAAYVASKFALVGLSKNIAYLPRRRRDIHRRLRRKLPFPGPQPGAGRNPEHPNRPARRNRRNCPFPRLQSVQPH